ncbi:MAG: hypothetical protein RIR18_966 [Pseudomonadota bacterium]|jgi:hypothetical protein
MASFPGDHFQLDQLVLPRPAIGYGVQHLGTDQLLNAYTATLIPIRQALQVQSVFETFEAAAAAGQKHLAQNPEIPLSIIPVGYDPIFDRLVLIQGVIQP